MFNCKPILDGRKLLLEIDHIYRDCYKQKKKNKSSLYSFYLNSELSKKKLQFLCKYCHIEKIKEEIKEVSKYLEIL